MFHFVCYWLSTARWRELKGVWFAKRYNTVTFGLLTNFFLHFFALRTFLTFRVARQAESFTMSFATAASCRAGRPLSPFKPLTILWMKWWKNKIDDENCGGEKSLLLHLMVQGILSSTTIFPLIFRQLGRFSKHFRVRVLKALSWPQSPWHFPQLPHDP